MWCIRVSFNWLVIEKGEHRKGHIPSAHCHIFFVPSDTVAASINVNQTLWKCRLSFLKMEYGWPHQNSLQSLLGWTAQTWERPPIFLQYWQIFQNHYSSVYPGNVHEDYSYWSHLVCSWMTVIIIHYSNDSLPLIFFSLLVGRTSSHVLKERVNSRTKKVLLLWSSIISSNLDLKLSDQMLWINPCQKFWHEFSLFAHILQLPSRKKSLNISEVVREGEF